MRILFAIKAMGNPGGGAERVLATVASGLAQRGHEVAIASSDAPGSGSYYPLHAAVEHVRLGIGRVEGKATSPELIRRALAMRRVVLGRRPDIVIGFMHSTYLPLGLALLGCGVPLIASEHIGPEHYSVLPLERAALQLAPLVSDVVTVVSEQIRQSFSPWLRRRMVVISNPVSGMRGDRSTQPDAAPGARRVLLSVGRLAPQKDQATLVRAFAKVAGRHPEWTLRIVGEGPLRPELEKLIAGSGMPERMELPGAVQDVGSEYARAGLFVLPSLYESFGLATAEALMSGLPVVGFAECAGTNELVSDGVNGLLVRGGDDRVAALADSLERLLADPALLARLAAGGSSRIEQMHGIDAVLDRWECMFDDVLARRDRALAGH